MQIIEDFPLAPLKAELKTRPRVLRDKIPVPVRRMHANEAQLLTVPAFWILHYYNFSITLLGTAISGETNAKLLQGRVKHVAINLIAGLVPGALNSMSTVPRVI